MRLNSFLTIIFLLSLLIWISCKHEVLIPSVDNTNKNPKDSTITVSNSSGWKCSPDTLYFQYEVLPIIVSKCASDGCHDAGYRAKGYILTDYINIMKKGIVVGFANSSRIYTEIANGNMPTKASGISMTTAQKEIIAKWINQGAKDVSCNPSYGICDTANIKFSTFVYPIIQNKCQGCHVYTAPVLNNYTQIKASIQSGKFSGSINHTSGFSTMPKGTNKLPDCELNKINAWIKAGASNN
jgi:uncharacterized membrane protein